MKDVDLQFSFHLSLSIVISGLFRAHRMSWKYSLVLYFLQELVWDLYCPLINFNGLVDGTTQAQCFLCWKTILTKAITLINIELIIFVSFLYSFGNACFSNNLSISTRLWNLTLSLFIRPLVPVKSVAKLLLSFVILEVCGVSSFFIISFTTELSILLIF
jgi:hypothetical protein